MTEIIYTFGQVEEIIPFNQLTSVASFTNATIAQDVLNASLTSDIERAFKYIQVVNEDTSVSSVMEEYQTILKDSNRYKELMTIPVASVSIPTENNFPTIVQCLPLFSDILKAPKKGQ